MIVVKYLLAPYRTAFMESNPSLTVLDQGGVNDQEKGTIADQERRADVTNPEVEIVMKTITVREVENVSGTGIEKEIGIESVTEKENIGTVNTVEGRGGTHRRRHFTEKHTWQAVCFM